MDNISSIVYLTCLQAEYKDSNNIYAWGPVLRDRYIIHYIKKGKGYFEVNGNKYTLNKGDSFLISPNQLVCYYPDIHDPWEYAWVMFDGAESVDLLSHCSLFYNTPVSPFPCVALDDFFKRSALNFAQSNPADLCRNDALLKLLIAEYISLYPAKKMNSFNTRISIQISEYIKHNYFDPNLNIETIKHKFGISHMTLHRKFIDEFGISPGNYLKKYRIEKACELLSITDQPIKFISHSVGFSDQMYFSKVFKKYTNYTPTQYRNKHANFL